MSFNWNLSSDDEEEEDIEGWTKRQGLLHGDGNDNKDTTSSDDDAKLQPTLHNSFSGAVFESDEEEENESIEWEDAVHNEISNTLQPVTIDLNGRNKAVKEVKTRKRVRREKYRFESLPPSQQSLLRNLHRAHVLTMTSRAVMASSCCAKEEVLAIAMSLIPETFWTKANNDSPPSLNALTQFMDWFSTWIGGAQQRRQERAAENRRAGAPRPRRSRVRQQQQQQQNEVTSEDTVFGFETKQLRKYAETLSSTTEGNPQLFENERIINNAVLRLALFVGMARSLGWRTRVVQAIDPISFDLTVHHPLLSSSSSASAENVPNMLEWTEIYCCLPSSSKRGKRKDDSVDPKRKWIHADPNHHIVNQPHRIEEVWRRKSNEMSRRQSNNYNITPGYVVAVEHALLEDNSEQKGVGRFHLTDVTARYASSWVEVLRQRGFVRGKKKMETEDTWWLDTVRTLNGKPAKIPNISLARTQSNGKSVSSAIVLSDEKDDRKPPTKEETVSLLDLGHHDDSEEAKELLASAKQEAIPTTKTAFRTSPLYVIPSLLGSTEVIDPNAKICGFVKGERVYLRSDVSVARPARQWPYHGRRVRDGEKPVKKVKARKRSKSTKSFQALTTYGVGKANDGSEFQRASIVEDAERQAEMDSQILEKGDEEWLYAIWQTDPWSPPYVGPTDPIPMNEHRNVEKALLPPGLLHVDIRGAAVVAKKLCIPYAPCLIGFEGYGGNRTPSISGIVVHEHNADLLREAMREVSQYELLNEEEKRRKTVLQRWKKLMVGLLLKERIDREYGDQEETDK